LSKNLRKGYISCSFHCKRCFNSSTLETRCNISILKVGMVPMYQAFKNKSGCDYRQLKKAINTRV